MQTNTLTIQSNTAAGNPNAASRNAAASVSDGAQFSAMLSNQIEQSLPPAPAPTAPKPEAPKPQAADKPAQPDEAPAPRQAAKPNETKSDGADETEAADESSDQAEDSEAAAKSDPATAMLALMASLQQPATDAKTKARNAAGQAFDALNGAAKGTRGETQLAALQAAMKSVAKDSGSEAAGTRTFSAASIKNPALAAAGADLASDAKATGADSADLRTALASTAVKAELKPELDAADLALQQARDAAAQATPAPAAALAQAQPAALLAAEAAAAAAGEALSARVGTSQWENQVGQKIVYMVGSEEQTASLTLNPPDLGPLQVVLSVSNDQASVTFSSNELEVRQALENALPRLREMMGESGIALGNASVNAGMPDQAQDQGARSSGFGRGSGQRGNGNDSGDSETAARPVTRTAIIGDRGMVDTFA
jgi:flagellar hook-length control protein FliK